MHTDDDDEEALRDYRKKLEVVKTAFRQRPHNVIEELEKLGFTYMVDDEEDAQELTEEQAARPADADEQALVAYLTGGAEPNERLLMVWRRATDPQGTPNYPLWRRFFRKGNPRLKQLMLFGLEHSPADRELLADLSFLHEFSPMLKELMALYLRACDVEENAERFKALAKDFDNHLHASGYEAFAALRERFLAHPAKAQWIEAVIAEQEREAGMLEF